MDLNIKQINKVNSSVATIIANEDIEKGKDKIANKYKSKVKIDGFRAGKVPVNVIKSRYADEIKQEAEQELLKQLLDEALEKMGKKDADVVGEPIFKKFDRNDKGIDVELLISLRPEVDVKNYKDSIPSYKSPRVVKKDIDEKKAELLAMYTPLKSLKTKRMLKKGDFALFDFEGFVDGKAFEGGKAENYSLEIGSGQFIPGFEEGMIGLKPGEEKDVEVKFPESYGANELAGKDAIFKVKLHAIQVKETPTELDEATLKQLLPNEKEPSEAKLDEQIKEQVKLEKMEKIFAEDFRPEFVENLIKNIDFELPENILEQELDMQVRQNWGTFSKKEIETFQKDPEALKKKRESYKEDAVKSVKLTFIIDALARELKINVEDQELMQKLYFEAYQQGQDPKAYVEMYQKQGLLPAVKMSMIEDKLLRTIFFDKNDENKKESK